MEQSNISGKWQGVITYGKKYKQFAGHELFFEAEIHQHGMHIEGISEDTGGVGVNTTPARLRGSLIENKISFIKQYEAFGYFELNGEEKIDQSIPGIEIYYKGELDPNAQYATGVWEYRYKLKLLYLIPFTYKAGGTWSMERK